MYSAVGMTAKSLIVGINYGIDSIIVFIHFRLRNSWFINMIHPVGRRDIPILSWLDRFIAHSCLLFKMLNFYRKCTSGVMKYKTKI